MMEAMHRVPSEDVRVPDVTSWMQYVTDRICKLEKENSALQSALANKAEASATPTLQQIEDLKAEVNGVLESKADSCGVLSMQQQLQQLSSAVDQKASQENLTSVQHELQNLTANFTRKAEMVQELWENMEDKDLDEVWAALQNTASQEQLQKVEATAVTAVEMLKSKAEVQQIQDLKADMDDALESKADVSGVLSAQQQLQQLTSDQKAGQDGLVSVQQELQSLSANVARKAEVVQELCEAIGDKDLDEVWTALQNTASQEQLQKVEATAMAAAEMLKSKANTDRVPTLQQWQELRSIVARKADTLRVPTNQQMKEMQNTVANMKTTVDNIVTPEEVHEHLSLKADAANVPTLDQFQELMATVHAKANVDEVPTKEQFEELRTPKRMRLFRGWLGTGSGDEKKDTRVQEKEAAPTPTTSLAATPESR